MKIMTKFHPDLDLMTEHVAGTISLAQSACLSVHIGSCEQCQRLAGQLSDIGATLFEGLDPIPETCSKRFGLPCLTQVFLHRYTTRTAG